ncbi:MAG: alpha/beta hydrolase [Acidimicrobiia bacterium]|nr:alpha/beta hydrolase [Acidimicrobiia bacterium]
MSDDDTSYRELQVPVAGGMVTAGRWGEGDRIVVASHGITANHRSWQAVGEQLVARSGGAVSLVAVDHRGRAGSAGVVGPYGLSQHADDLIAILDHLDLEGAVLTGHSMGGFVVALAAERHAGRVDALALVDGGLPFPLQLPPDVDTEAVIRSVIGPALDRLDQRWPDVDSYLGFFQAHPAFSPPNTWHRAADAYVRYDAVIDDDGQVRSSVNREAVLVDGGAAIVDPDSSSALRRIDQPSVLLWAPRGILDQSPGLYHADQIADASSELDHLTAALVDDTNHYTILVGEAGAARVVETILGLAA